MIDPTYLFTGFVLAVVLFSWIAHRNGYQRGYAAAEFDNAFARVMVPPSPRVPAPPRTRDPWRMTPDETFALAVNPETEAPERGGQFVPEAPAIGDRRIVKVVALDPPLYRLDQYDENDNRFARWYALPVGRGRNGLFETRHAAAEAMIGPKTVSYSRVTVAAPAEPDTDAETFPVEDVTAKQPDIWTQMHAGKWAVFDRGIIVSGPIDTQEEAQAEVSRRLAERTGKIGHYVEAQADGRWAIFYKGGYVAGLYTDKAVAEAAAAALDIETL